MGDFIQKCLICGNSLDRKKLNVNLKSHSDIFEAWKSECSTAICEILFGTENDIFYYYLQNSEYCSSCYQIIRDIGFLWKQAKVIKNKISKLSARIRCHLNTNYKKIDNKSEMNTINEKVLILLQNVGTNVGENNSDLSYEEIVELIHTASVLQHESQPQSVNEVSTSEGKVKESDQENKIFVEQAKLASIKAEIDEYPNYEDSELQLDSRVSSPVEGKAVTEHRKRTNPSGCTRNPDFVEDTQFKIDIEYENYFQAEADTDEDDTINSLSLEDDTTNSQSLEDDTTNSQSLEDDCKIRKFRRRLEGKGSAQKLLQTEKSKRGRKHKQNTGNDIKKRYKGESKVYCCTKCPKKFQLKKALLKHTRVNHKNIKKKQSVLKLYCSFCGKRFLEEEDLTLHYSVAHQEPNPFMCAFCPEIHTNCVDLKKHTREFHHDPEKPPRCICDTCGKSFITKYLLKYHLRLHGDQNLLYACSICDMKFTAKSWLNKHMEKHTETKYECDQCGKFYPHLQNLKIHKRNSHQENGYECRICGETLPTLGKRERHEISHKEILASKVKQSKMKIKNAHECKFCGKCYTSEEERNLHNTKAHLDPNPFSCGFCPEIFSNSYDLRGHMKLVHPEPSEFLGKVKCDLCDRYFANKHTLKSHSVVHGDPSLLFNCDLCSKVFISQHSLKRHLQRHTEKRNCVCETCGKSFKNLDDLKSHARYHDESQKKFQCKICDKKFMTLTKCKRHEATHTNIKEFVCHVCGKAFNNKGNLSTHFQMHTGDGSSHIRGRKLKLN